MKALIAAEVRKRELATNIKLGPGGIREIEFIAQSLQLVRGGSDQQLRCSELQVVLPRLGDGRGLAATDVGDVARCVRVSTQNGERDSGYSRSTNTRFAR